MPKDHAKKIRKYFAPFPKWTIWLIVLGTIGLVAYGAGIVLILIGLVGVLMWRSKPSDAQIDAWIESDLAKLKPRALNRTGLEGVRLMGETAVVLGPRFWDTGVAFVGVKVGKDEVVRFTPIGVTLINFTENQLVAYQCALDLTTDQPLSESTDEYFYQDVVSVSTQTRSVTYDKSTLSRQARKRLKPLMKGGQLQLNSAEEFILTTSGGTSIRVVLTDPQLVRMAGGGTIPTTAAEKAIGSVRTMLRQKKAG